MASPKYIKTMDRLLSTFRRAGEPVRVTVRWVPDFKDTTREGFHVTGRISQNQGFYAFNYRKLTPYKLQRFVMSCCHGDVLHMEN